MRCASHCSCFKKGGKNCCYCRDYPTEEQRLESFLESKLNPETDNKPEEKKVEPSEEEDDYVVL